VFIGGSAEVQDGASLVGPVLIGAGSVVEGGAHVERTVVMEHTRIGGNAYFKDKIVGSHYCADTDGTVLDGRHTDTAWLFADARSLDNGLTADQEDILDLAMRHPA
jgi:mannose-1-phosphate guanylyltransferase